MRERDRERGGKVLRLVCLGGWVDGWVGEREREIDEEKGKIKRN